MPTSPCGCGKWRCRAEERSRAFAAHAAGEGPVAASGRHASLWLTVCVSTQPAIEMLWETAVGAEELTRRFGFVHAADAASWVIDVLHRHWNLEVSRCNRIVISDQNAMAWVEADRRSLIAKWSARQERFDHLIEAAQVVSWLDGVGIPVAAPIAAIDGRCLIEFGAVGVKPRLPRQADRLLVGVLPVACGDLLAVDDHRHVADAGRMLAKLHEALAAYPGLVGGRHREARVQLVHNDFRAANILHDGCGISAVLDFEEISWKTRVADLVKASVMLATRYRAWGPTSDSVRADFVEAYDAHAVEPLSGAERAEFAGGVTALLDAFGWA